MSGENDLVVVGLSAVIYDNPKVAVIAESLLIHWNNVLIDRYDVRNLVDNVNVNCVQPSAEPDFFESDRYFDYDNFEDLLFERYQDLYTSAYANDSGAFNNTIEQTEECSYDSWNHNTYRSDRTEIWTRSDHNENEAAEDIMLDQQITEVEKRLERESEVADFKVPQFPPELLSFFAVEESSICDDCLDTVNNTLTKGLDDTNSITYIPFPTRKKVYDIILHTVKHVRMKGGQLEILLRVNQADNPLFSFLSPESDLRPFYDRVKCLPEEYFWDMLLEKTVAPQVDSTNQFNGNAEGSALSLIGLYNDDDNENDYSNELNHPKTSENKDESHNFDKNEEPQAVDCADDTKALHRDAYTKCLGRHDDATAFNCNADAEVLDNKYYAKALDKGDAQVLNNADNTQALKSKEIAVGLGTKFDSQSLHSNLNALVIDGNVDVQSFDSKNDAVAVDCKHGARRLDSTDGTQALVSKSDDALVVDCKLNISFKSDKENPVDVKNQRVQLVGKDSDCCSGEKGNDSTSSDLRHHDCVAEEITDELGANKTLISEIIYVGEPIQPVALTEHDVVTLRNKRARLLMRSQAQENNKTQVTHGVEKSECAYEQTKKIDVSLFAAASSISAAPEPIIDLEFSSQIDPTSGKRDGYVGFLPNYVTTSSRDKHMRYSRSSSPSPGMLTNYMENIANSNNEISISRSIPSSSPAALMKHEEKSRGRSIDSDMNRESYRRPHRRRENSRDSSRNWNSGKLRDTIRDRVYESQSSVMSNTSEERSKSRSRNTRNSPPSLPNRLHERSRSRSKDSRKRVRSRSWDVSRDASRDWYKGKRSGKDEERSIERNTPSSSTKTNRQEENSERRHSPSPPTTVSTKFSIGSNKYSRQNKSPLEDIDARMYHDRDNEHRSRDRSSSNRKRNRNPSRDAVLRVGQPKKRSTSFSSSSSESVGDYDPIGGNLRPNCKTAPVVIRANTLEKIAVILSKTTLKSCSLQQSAHDTTDKNPSNSKNATLESSELVENRHSSDFISRIEDEERLRLHFSKYLDPSYLTRLITQELKIIIGTE